MYTLRIKQHFDAAHFLVGYDGDCARVHGHTWSVEVVIQRARLNEIGIAIDFKDMKSVLKDMLPDHKCLNDCYTFNPTAENLAKRFYDELKVILRDDLVKVIVWESPDCCVEYG